MSISLVSYIILLYMFINMELQCVSSHRAILADINTFSNTFLKENFGVLIKIHLEFVHAGLTYFGIGSGSGSVSNSDEPLPDDTVYWRIYASPNLRQLIFSLAIQNSWNYHLL